jgi:hypothetical protein
MSCFMLSAAHFDAMADYVATHNLAPAYVLRRDGMQSAHADLMLHTGGSMPDGLRAYRAVVGAVLHAQNKRSVCARYSDTTDAEFPAYQCQRVAITISAQRALAAVACYRYQANETHDCEQSLAFAICTMIEEHAIAALRDGEPWGLEEEHVRPAGAPIPVSIFEMSAARRRK